MADTSLPQNDTQQPEHTPQESVEAWAALSPVVYTDMTPPMNTPNTPVPAQPKPPLAQPTPEEELEALIIEDFTIHGICGVY